MASTESVTSTSSKKKSNFHCCVPLCTSDSRYDASLHFHHIPKNEELRRQWITKIRRDEGQYFKITSSTVVCSKHFCKDDYSSYTPVRKRLQPSAVPSKFTWTEEKTPRRALKRKILSPVKMTREESDTQPDVCDISTDIAFTNDLEDTRIQEIKTLRLLLEETSAKCESLEKQLKMERFGINRFTTDDSLILFYTGFSTYKQFLMFYKCIEPTAQNMRSMYYVPSDTISLAGRKRNMLLIDELFMFLCRLRAGLMEQDLTVRFNTPLPTISRKIITWANFLYFVLGKISIWLSRKTIDEYMPECFKTMYPKTRVVIDCAEIKTQHPSSLVLNSQMYSNYKGACTFKCLLGVSPHGLVTFISPLYTGCMSDVEITRLSGILDLLEPGDEVMADKAFTLTKVLAEKQVKLTIPAFLCNKRKFTVGEVKETEQIAKLRIHIERVNSRIKEYHLFDAPLPLSLAGTANQLWSVACLLSNFKGPIVQAWTKT